MKRDFIEDYSEKYKYPYPKHNKPELGPNDLIADGYKAVKIEMRARGKGLLNNNEVDYMDIRVYLGDK
jgi:hypothetical protein